MNVVVFQFNNVFDGPLLRNILKEIKAETVYNFWTLPLNRDMRAGENIAFNVVEKYNEVLNIFDHDLEHVNFSTLYPLDEEVLQKMAPFEMESKKIVSRYATTMDPRFVKDDLKGIRKTIDQWLCFRGDHFSSDSMSYYHINYLYNRLVRFWNDFYHKNKVDLVLSEFVPHGPIDYIGYRMGSIHNVPSVFSYFTHSTMNQYFLDKIEMQREDFPALDSKERRIHGPIILNKGNEKEYERLTTPAKAQKMPWGGDVQAIEVLKNKLMDNERSISESAADAYPSKYQKGKDPARRFFVRMFNAFVKLPFVKKYKFSLQQETFYEAHCTDPDFKAPYIYLPLHYQPEATSCPLGGVYDNQVLIAQMLDYHLPDNWLIYIKEHHAASDFSNRSLDVYKQFLELKKVRFVSKKTSTFDLMSECKAVCTITGTAGWEGLFKGKPCLFFGNHISQFCPGMFRIRTNEDCKAAIKKIVEGVEITLDSLRQFMKSLENVTVPTSSERFTYIQKEIDDKEWLEIVTNGYVVKIKEVLQKK